MFGVFMRRKDKIFIYTRGHESSDVQKKHVYMQVTPPGIHGST